MLPFGQIKVSRIVIFKPFYHVIEIHIIVPLSMYPSLSRFDVCLPK